MGRVVAVHVVVVWSVYLFLAVVYKHADNLPTMFWSPDSKLVQTCHREPLSELLMDEAHGVRHRDSELSSLKYTKEEVRGI